jgi:hypothetical protein
MAGQQAGAAKGLGFGVYLACGICALFVAFAADLMQPRGPFLTFQVIVFALVTAILALLSFLPAIKRTLRLAAAVALISVIVFGGILAVRTYVAPAKAQDRGMLATLLPPAADLQRFILAESKKREDLAEAETAAAAAAPIPLPNPALSPSEEALAALTAAIGSTDPASRLRAGVEALASRDPALLAPAIDRLYRSADPALRQLAITKLLAQRKGARLPLLVINAQENDQAFANALQGAGITLRAVNETSGVVEGGLCAPTGMSGTINRASVTLTGKCKVGDAERNTVVTLQPTDDFRLAGEARNDQGQVVRVELSLL